MIVHHGRESHLAELCLSALTSHNGLILHDNMRWSLDALSNSAEGQESDEAEPVFMMVSGVYELHVYYKGALSHRRKVRLRGHTMVDMTIILGGIQVGDHENPFDLSEDEKFNEISRYRQRALEREGHRQLADINGSMREPMDDPDLDGPDAGVMDPAALPSEAPAGGNGAAKSHPMLSDKVQFDGMDKQVSQENDSNMDVELTFQHSNTPSTAPQATRH